MHTTSAGMYTAAKGMYIVSTGVYTTLESMYAIAGLMFLPQASDLRKRNPAQRINLAIAYIT